MKKTTLLMALLAVFFTTAITAVADTTDDPVPMNAVPSRSVTLQKNQYLDVVYPGTGWIYLGEIDATSLLKYSGRKMSEESTSFTLRGREEGSAILHFFKNDALTGEYIDDYLAVTVQGVSRVSDHIKAPMYADIVPPRPSFTESVILAEAIEHNKEIEVEDNSNAEASVEETAKGTVSSEIDSATENHVAANTSSKGATVIQNTSAVDQASNAGTVPVAKKESEQKEAASSVNTENLSSSEILSMAQKAFDEKEYEKCLAYLESFFEKTEGNIDEGMYLQGRTLESPSAIRDIKKSLSIYKTIVRQYPESTVWEKANERITYIERFYFDIR